VCLSQENSLYVVGTKDCNETVLNLCDDYRTLYDSYMKADHDKIKLDRQLVNDACRYIYTAATN